MRGALPPRQPADSSAGGMTSSETHSSAEMAGEERVSRTFSEFIRWRLDRPRRGDD